jgi:hypothetical protein
VDRDVVDHRLTLRDDDPIGVGRDDDGACSSASSLPVPAAALRWDRIAAVAMSQVAVFGRFAHR